MTDTAAAERALAELAIETPSWGYGDSGTRFATFQQPGRPRDVFERLEDAAEVHRLTGAAPSVAMHFPWDAVDDYDGLARHAGEPRPARRRRQPEPVPGPRLQARLGHPSRRAGAPQGGRAPARVRRDRRGGSGHSAISLWLADGTNYPGQDDLVARRRRMLDGLGELYAALPRRAGAARRVQALRARLLRDRPRRLGLGAARLPEARRARARCSSTSATTRRARTSSRSSRCSTDEGRLGGFHFNNRKYADDDLIVGSVNPFELFLIFCELAGTGRPLPRLTIDQAHNVEAKVEAMVLSIVNLQEAYAKALLVDREALAGAQARGDVLGGHEVLLDAYRTDVRPLCARVRAAAGAAEDPVAAHRASGYAERIAAERGATAGVAGGWGR